MAPKVARDVNQIVNFVNPDLAIEDKDDWSRCYVKRENSPVQQMIRHLLEETNFPKLLFTGPRGCGKEMELIRISHDKKIKREFHVKIISGEADIGKLLKKIYESVLAVAKAEGADIAKIEKEVEDIKNNKEGWTTDKEYVGTKKTNTSNGPDFGKFKPEETAMKIILKKPDKPGEAPDYVKFINELTEKIYLKRIFKKKEVLILISNLDKIDKDKAEELFISDKLTKLECFMVYTFPFEATTSAKFAEILNKYSNEIYYLTHVNPSLENGIIMNPDYDFMKQVLIKRIDKTLFKPPDEIIDELINYSGGVLYELLKLTVECARYALRRKSNRQYFFLKTKITWEILDEIIKRRKRLYENTFKGKKDDIINVLKNIITEKYDKLSNDHFKTLKDLNLVVQIGPENDVWDNIRYRINPLMLETFPELRQKPEQGLPEKVEQKEAEITKDSDGE